MLAKSRFVSASGSGEISGELLAGKAVFCDLSPFRGSDRPASDVAPLIQHVVHAPLAYIVARRDRVQIFASHLVCGFVDISGRDEPRVLLVPAATAAKVDLVYVHDHDGSVLHV